MPSLGVNLFKYCKPTLGFNSVVACTPVKLITSAMLGEIEPTAEVVETPVKGIPNSTTMEPTEDVADTPVGNTVNPMPIEPTDDVVDTPVNGIISIRPAVIEPTAEVVESPVKVNETSVRGDIDPN